MRNFVLFILIGFCINGYSGIIINDNSNIVFRQGNSITIKAIYQGEKLVFNPSKKNFLVDAKRQSYSTLTEDRLMRFDDYANTTLWIQHDGPLAGTSPGKKALKAGTNHYHRTGWRALSCRTGTAIAYGLIIPPSDVYTATNYAANLRNDLGAMVESPVFSNGIGTVYFEAINNLAARPTRILVSLVTNMMNNVTGWPTNLVLDAETPAFSNIWIALDDITLNAGNINGFTRYINMLNLRCPARLRIQRWGGVAGELNDSPPGSETYGGVYTDLGTQDDGFTVIDNIRVSPPPTSMRVYKSPDYTGLGYDYEEETP